MRKLIAIGITGLLILSGCTDKKKLEEAEKQNDGGSITYAFTIKDGYAVPFQ